ncbi:heme exporter protein CcmB [Actinobacillus genomosp. 2]|nr:heme exporter protein CcmB [Actinobacillus genomosp. 2]WGE31495.1 heme exporter protein CcmB [Actinobacillus genomosp. 2]
MILLTIIQRELTIAFRKPAEILNPLWFFLIVITLFPLLMGPNPELLGKIAPVWRGLRHCFRHCFHLNDYFVMII